jgi:hypothetical protein
MIRFHVKDVPMYEALRPFLKVSVVAAEKVLPVTRIKSNRVVAHGEQKKN